jgi:hypothetical protein
MPAGPLHSHAHPVIPGSDADDGRLVLERARSVLDSGPGDVTEDLDLAMTSCAARLLTLRARLIRLGDATAHLAERGFGDPQVADQATALAHQRRRVLEEYTELRAVMAQLRALLG